MKFKDTFYKEYSNGKWNYWTYSDGQRVYLDAKWAQGEIARGGIKLVIVK